MSDEKPNTGLPTYGYSNSMSLPSIVDIPGGVAPWASRSKESELPSSTSSSNAAGHAPKALAIPPLKTPYNFVVPRKRITGNTDMEKFLASETLALYLGFVVNLSNSVKGLKLSHDSLVSEPVKNILSLLEVLSGWVDSIPPVATAVRYGNPAFREWHNQLEKEGPNLVSRILPMEMKEALIELYPYFADSFGNATRIDYGTGHEVNFAAWILCLHRLQVVSEEDYQAIVLKVFVKYLDLMRKLQITYWLEPAGSHGVWGLDDYHFLPFIFGSSQLMGHKYMKPKSIHNPDILESFSSEYLYLQCIAFIKKVKKGHIAENSPMINDISAVATWDKVNSGMLKMYKAECLGKVPIMQHFLFGSILPWPQ